MRYSGNDNNGVDVAVVFYYIYIYIYLNLGATTCVCTRAVAVFSMSMIVDFCSSCSQLSFLRKNLKKKAAQHLEDFNRFKTTVGRSTLKIPNCENDNRVIALTASQ